MTIIAPISMKPGDREKLQEYYSEKLRTYGHDARSLGWAPGGRRARFGALTAIGDLEGSSVLDVGCGFGDLYEYLAGRGISVVYTGIDISPEFIEIARKACPGARFKVADFEEEDVIEAFDWAFASGIFTIRLNDNPAFTRNLLEKMFAACRKGFAADFLSPVHGSGEGDTYWRCQPEDALKLCRSLSKRVVLRCDYMRDEFCVYVYRNDTADERNVYYEFEASK
jgi:SAM-dependent methyltransferase